MNLKVFFFYIAVRIKKEISYYCFDLIWKVGNNLVTRLATGIKVSDRYFDKTFIKVSVRDTFVDSSTAKF